MSKNAKDLWLSLLLVVIGSGLFILGLLVEDGVAGDHAHAELCPTILEKAETAEERLAVFQKHEGCWEYVQGGQP